MVGVPLSPALLIYLPNPYILCTHLHVYMYVEADSLCIVGTFGGLFLAVWRSRKKIEPHNPYLLVAGLNH